MAVKQTTKTAANTSVTVDETTVTDNGVIVDDDKNISKTNNRKKTVNVKPLNDTDEIEVVSLIPNVSYKDSHTGDFYEWDEVGHSEFMTFETLKNMWKNSRGYFRNMWLKPIDDRVINKFGLTSIFEKYEFLMDEFNYTRKNIPKICDSISSTPNGLKFAICNKIKNLVVSGKITDISVIRSLEKHLNLDLTSFLD